MDLAPDTRLWVFRLIAATLMLAIGATLLPVASLAQSTELLMFEEPGCPWCRKWRAEVGIGYPHSPEGQRAPLRVIDITQPRPVGIQLNSAVRFSPTFVLVVDGREVGRITGYPGADFFWGLLEGLLRKVSQQPVPAENRAGTRGLEPAGAAP